MDKNDTYGEMESVIICAHRVKMGSRHTHKNPYSRVDAISGLSSAHISYILNIAGPVILAG